MAFERPQVVTGRTGTQKRVTDSSSGLNYSVPSEGASLPATFVGFGLSERAPGAPDAGLSATGVPLISGAPRHPIRKHSGREAMQGKAERN